MPTPATLLASALEQLSALQRAGRVAIRSGDLPRGARERLLRNGVLQEVMRGWYVRASPGEQAGDTTAWYAAFWPFVASYLDSRIGTDWCVSADPSLLLHVGDRTVPRQLLVRSPRGNNKPTPLMHGTSVFDVRLELPPPEERAVIDGVRAMTLGASLVHASPGLYHDRVVDVRAALVTIPDASDLLRPLLAGGKSKVAGRLAGAAQRRTRTRRGRGPRRNAHGRLRSPGERPLRRCRHGTVDTRDAYLAALEEASVRQDIVPFTRFLAESATASGRLHRA